VPAPSIEGVVTFPDGKPVEGATVSITSAGQNEERTDHGMIGVGSSMNAKTGADGRFRISEGVYTYAKYGLTAQAPGGARARADVRLPDWVLRRRGVVVSGRVTNSRGEPVEGARVTCWFNLPDGDNYVLTTGTAADGRYSQEGPWLEGGEVIVQLWAAGFDNAEQRPTIEAGGGAALVADFKLVGWASAT